MTDINTLIDNIIFRRAAAEDAVRARRSAAANRVAAIIVPFLPFLIAAAIIAVGIIVASI